MAATCLTISDGRPEERTEGPDLDLDAWPFYGAFASASAGVPLLGLSCGGLFGCAGRAAARAALRLVARLR